MVPPSEESCEASSTVFPMLEVNNKGNRFLKLDLKKNCCNNFVFYIVNSQTLLSCQHYDKGETGAFSRHE